MNHLGSRVWKLVNIIQQEVIQRWAAREFAYKCMFGPFKNILTYHLRAFRLKE
jgi:hypothetical protein